MCIFGEWNADSGRGMYISQCSSGLQLFKTRSWCILFIVKGTYSVQILTSYLQQSDADLLKGASHVSVSEKNGEDG